MVNFLFHPDLIGRDLFNIERFGLVQYVILVSVPLCYAVAAMAHSYVFPAEAYHYVPHSKNGKAIIETAKEEVKLSGSGKEEKKEAFVEKTETRVEAAGTSVTESVQDIVVQGGQHVVKDVVLTINQAMGPVEKGVTKIHEKFHRRSTSSGLETEEESEIEVEKQ
ncbi:unnamed protein product [Linum tenue]|uniref:Uncharacterized protein n=1 Tax=Linum tenue TaxID=586396 RepID=A0AAV0MQ29_9ROSI|nr:unnamed protein product [Linum tenue]